MNIRRADRLASQTVRFGYTVSGETPFPLGMLSFDGAYPAAQIDAVNIHASLAQKITVRRTINLVTVRGKDWLPIQARWRQHGWRVE